MNIYSKIKKIKYYLHVGWFSKGLCTVRTLMRSFYKTNSLLFYFMEHLKIIIPPVWSLKWCFKSSFLKNFLPQTSQQKFLASARWVFLWAISPPGWVNVLLQIWQTSGLYPVWVLKWSSSLNWFAKNFPQISQQQVANFLSDFSWDNTWVSSSSL